MIKKNQLIKTFNINFCIIGVGSVVTKSIPDYHISIGNPARLVKKYNSDTNCWESL